MRNKNYLIFMPLFIVALILLLTLAGCGSSSPTGGTGGGGGNTVAGVVKFTNGNTWTYAVLEATSSSVLASTSANYTETTVVSNAVANTSATYTTSTTKVGGTPYTSTWSFDAAGNLIVNSSFTGTMQALPAQITIGNSWLVPIPMVNASATYTIGSTNASYTGPAGTFNNLIRIDMSMNSTTTMFNLPTVATMTGYILYSTTIGNAVFETYSITTTTFGTTSATDITKVLQPGYIAN